MRVRLEFELREPNSNVDLLIAPSHAHCAVAIRDAILPPHFASLISLTQIFLKLSGSLLSPWAWSLMGAVS